VYCNFTLLLNIYIAPLDEHDKSEMFSALNYKMSNVVKKLNFSLA